nr:MAG TPA: HISTONE H3-LIKE CENTROMERIC PROTEIN CSE4 CYCLE, KINETOCHORE, CENTROMERE, HISTONE.32A [Caudoviricetes sp.]
MSFIVYLHIIKKLSSFDESGECDIIRLQTRRTRCVQALGSS